MTNYDHEDKQPRRRRFYRQLNIVHKGDLEELLTPQELAIWGGGVL